MMSIDRPKQFEHWSLAIDNNDNGNDNDDGDSSNGYFSSSVPVCIRGKKVRHETETETEKSWTKIEERTVATVKSVPDRPNNIALTSGPL